jgi:hypothetical protein
MLVRRLVQVAARGVVDGWRCFRPGGGVADDGADHDAAHVVGEDRSGLLERISSREGRASFVSFSPSLLPLSGGKRGPKVRRERRDRYMRHDERTSIS